jgi:large subunit ribosomal protein L24
MKIRRHDIVKILNGKDKGKTGKVLKVLMSKNDVNEHLVVVEGLNLRYKHTRARRTGEKGQRVMFPFPVHMSRVALVCPKCGRAVRVGIKVLEKMPETSREMRQRICKKCAAII